MSNILIAIFAYIIDKIFGEFKCIKHPVIIIGELISFFENKFYKDSIFMGFLLVTFVLVIVGVISISFELLVSQLNYILYIIISSLVSSMFLAHKMLYDSVKNILTTSNKKEEISQLVSRDVEQMSESDIYKASIETYAENLSDGVIAPLMYLSLFGVVGIIIYKSINTMDSMVGYRDKKYENFGKVAAILDDIVNYIPSRITAILIMILTRQKNLLSFYKYGKKHDSPNAGHPISAMALGIKVSLGGDTHYFGKLKKKAYFGKAKKIISKNDLMNALNIKPKVDITIILLLCSSLLLQ